MLRAMSDEPTSTPAANDDTEPAVSEPGASEPAGSEPAAAGSGTGAGVTIPSWLASALVVVLAFVVAGAGFAIGRATASDDRGELRPVVARGGGPQTRTFPLPGRGGGADEGPRGLPPGFPRGPEGREGDEESRRLPGFPDDLPGDSPEDSPEDSGEDDSSEAPDPPQLPGT
jgi:hypothetical protein